MLLMSRGDVLTTWQSTWKFSHKQPSHNIRVVGDIMSSLWHSGTLEVAPWVPLHTSRGLNLKNKSWRHAEGFLWHLNNPYSRHTLLLTRFFVWFPRPFLPSFTSSANRIQLFPCDLPLMKIKEFYAEENDFVAKIGIVVVKEDDLPSLKELAARRILAEGKNRRSIIHYFLQVS